jgi:hypothetical protein
MRVFLYLIFFALDLGKIKYLVILNLFQDLSWR